MPRASRSIWVCARHIGDEQTVMCGWFVLDFDEVGLLHAYFVVKAHREGPDWSSVFPIRRSRPFPSCASTTTMAASCRAPSNSTLGTEHLLGERESNAADRRSLRDCDDQRPVQHQSICWRSEERRVGKERRA